MFYTEYDSTRRMTLFSYIRRNIAEMHTYRYAYYNLVKNMLRTRYRRSASGVASSCAGWVRRARSAAFSALSAAFSALASARSCALRALARALR